MIIGTITIYQYKFRTSLATCYGLSYSSYEFLNTSLYAFTAVRIKGGIL